MTRHRKTKRRIYRGGDWFSPSTWFSGSSDLTEKAKSGFSSGLNSAESSLGNISNSVSNSFSSLSSYNPFSSSTDSSTSYSSPAPASSTTYMPPAVGGRHRRGHRGRSRKSKLRGGKGGLGLTYYATPVSGLKVAEPTYWIKGGTKRRRHTRRR